MTHDIQRLRLARASGVGPVLYRRLILRFGSAEAAINALPDITRRAGRLVAPSIPTVTDVERELAELHALGGTMLFVDTPDYPALLALMADAPSRFRCWDARRRSLARRWRSWEVATPRPMA